jgi:hypothetical protein
MIFRMLCVFIIGNPILVKAVTKTSSNQMLNLCLTGALDLRSPLARDRARENCLRIHHKKLSITQCMALAKDFEYSNFTEEMKALCLFETSPRKIDAKSCFYWANQFEYAETSDNAKWECFQRFDRQMSRSVCLQEAQTMRLPTHAIRARLACR